MIDMPLDKINIGTIDALIVNGIAERRTLEFKESVPLAGRDDRKEFLKDVSALANSAGGDLVIGIAQNDAGEARGKPGILIENYDIWKLTIENLLRDGITPRMPPVEFHRVSVGPDTYVVILRVRQSWYGPHRVEMGTSKFYGRNSAGAFEMDVTQLRNAFTLSDTLTKRIQDFRTLSQDQDEHRTGHSRGWTEVGGSCLSGSCGCQSSSVRSRFCPQ